MTSTDLKLDVSDSEAEDSGAVMLVSAASAADGDVVSFVSFVCVFVCNGLLRVLGQALMLAFLSLPLSCTLLFGTAS
jgi:hypothetical protein